MEAQFGVAKVPKYGLSVSGDTLEVIERPQGGISAVLADGQRSGRSARIISNIVVRKAISLLGEGVRDGAAARAAHDYLRTHRGGQVSAELQLLSVDLHSRTIVISRNSHCPVFVATDDRVSAFDCDSEPVGIRANVKPVIRELPLQAPTYVVAFTDGLLAAGRRWGGALALERIVAEGVADEPSALALADSILATALAADNGHPSDDICVLVLAVLPGSSEQVSRRLSLILPF